MSKPPSPLLGFNNNVRHKGRVFHIQTEDSGVRHPHIITHLFMDGGRILKTTKTSYAEHLGVDKYADKVRGIMKEQHKAMFVALRDGDFDAIIAASPAPVTAKAPAGSPSEPPRAAPPPDPTARATEHVDPIAAPAATRAKPLSILPPPRAPSEAPPAATPASIRPGGSGPVDVDFAALERAAYAAAEDFGDGGRISSPGLGITHSDLPPPPSNIVTRPGGQGSYREVTKSEPRRTRPPPARASERPPSSRKSGKPPPAVLTRPSRPPPSTGRYAVSTRPQPLAGAARPPEGRSIFGEELISEKSLDEVILSYLAEDLDASPKK